MVWFWRAAFSLSRGALPWPLSGGPRGPSGATSLSRPPQFVLILVTGTGYCANCLFISLSLPIHKDEFLVPLLPFPS